MPQQPPVKTNYPGQNFGPSDLSLPGPSSTPQSMFQSYQNSVFGGNPNNIYTPDFTGTRNQSAMNQQFPNLSQNPNFLPGADMTAQQRFQQYQNQIYGNDTASVYTPRFATGVAPAASPVTNPMMGPGASLTQPQPAGQLTQLGLGQSRLV
jgi:hypothetical protein